MPNYRGGGNEIDPYTSQAIHNISTGNTPVARRRALERRIALAAAQAGLVGLSGAISGAQSEHDENKYKRNVMARAIESAKRKSADDQLHYRNVPMAGAGRGPGLPVEGREEYPMGDVPNINEIGNAGLAQDDANKSAAGAPVTWGGKQQYTPSGLDDMVQNANVVGSDENLGKNIIRSTGSDFVDNNRPEMNTALSPRDAYGGLLNSKVR